MRNGKTRTKHRIRAEPGLVRGAVKRDHFVVDSFLIGGIYANQQFCDLGVDVVHRFGHALAEISIATITQLDGLMLASRST